MIKHYDLTESDVSAKPFESESIYYCTDSSNIYLDSPRLGKRVKISSDIIILDTEEDREAELAPIPLKFYYIRSNGKVYIYDTDEWLCINQYDIVNNLTTDDSNKSLSAAQGVVLKSLIDNLSKNKLDSSSLPDAINTALKQAKESGEFDGYTPVKGTDYWTDEDKAEMKAYIDQAILEGEW